LVFKFLMKALGKEIKEGLVENNHLKSNKLGVMTKNNENIEVSGIESKFTRITLTIVLFFLIFVGPTYIPYLLDGDVFTLDYIASIGFGAWCCSSWA
jgi:hypothetical protein